MIGEKQNLVNSKISKDFGWQTGYRRFSEVLSDRQTRSKPRSTEGQIVQPINSRESESTILRSPDIIPANIIPDKITNRTKQVEVRNPSVEPWLRTGIHGRYQTSIKASKAGSAMIMKMISWMFTTILILEISLLMMTHKEMTHRGMTKRDHLGFITHVIRNTWRWESFLWRRRIHRWRLVLVPR